MSLFLCAVLESDLVSFFYKWLTSFPSTTCWRDCLFSVVYSASFVKDKVSIDVDLSLGFPFCSIDLYFCFCASTILSWWLWLCSRARSQADWFLQFHSSFSRLLWLFEVFCISIQIVKLFVLALLGEKVVSLSYSSAILGPPLHYFLDESERGNWKSWLKNQNSEN